MSGTKLPLQRRKEKEQLTVEKDASYYLQNMVQETSLSKNAWDRDAGVPGQIGQVLCLVKRKKLYLDTTDQGFRQRIHIE